MVEPKIHSFDEALEKADKTRHVLLGNGFSIACRDDIFTYDALFERADFKDLSTEAKQAFEVLDTNDFEEVMRALQFSAKLTNLYQAGDNGVAEGMARDAEALREVLVNAIADSHPDHPNEITSEEYNHCRRFLSNFNKIYTFNYDLLLYWALMKDDVGPPINTDDGFRYPYDKDTDYVTWEPDNTHDQNIYYLHGALHIFDAGTEIQKYTWVNTGVRLTEQIRNALQDEKYPLFVSEGNTDKKLERIRHSDFLARGRQSFSRIGGSLFIYGHSLSPNDEHYLELIERGRIKSLFVSIYGDPKSDKNQKIMERALQISENSDKKGSQLEVRFFDAESAEVWG
jgi:hypothetical protein